SSLLMTRDAVRAGAGVALLPRSVIAADAEAGNVEIWSSVPHRTSELWVLHTSRRLVSTKITAFVRLLLAAFPDGTGAPKSHGAPADSTADRACGSLQSSSGATRLINSDEPPLPSRLRGGSAILLTSASRRRARLPPTVKRAQAFRGAARVDPL